MPIPVYSDYYFKLPGSSVSPTFSSGALGTPTYTFAANYPQPTYQGTISTLHTPVKVLKATTGQGIVVQNVYNESNSFYRLGVKVNSDNTSGGALYAIPDAYYQLTQKTYSTGNVDDWTVKRNKKYHTWDYRNSNLAGNHATIKVTKPSAESWTNLQRIFKSEETGAYSNVQKAGWFYYGCAMGDYSSGVTSAILIYSVEYAGNMLGCGGSYTKINRLSTLSIIPQDSYYDDQNEKISNQGSGNRQFGYNCGIDATSGQAYIFNTTLSFTDDEIRGYLPATPYIKSMVPVFSNTAIVTEREFIGSTLTYKGHFADSFGFFHNKNTLDYTSPLPIAKDYDKGIYNDSDHMLLIDGTTRNITKKTKYTEQEYSNVSWRSAFGPDISDFHSTTHPVYASISGNPVFGLPYQDNPYFININYDDPASPYYYTQSVISGAGYINLEPINKVIVPYMRFNIIFDEYANSIFTAGDFVGANVILYKLSYLNDNVDSARWNKIGTYPMSKTVVASSPIMGGIDEAVFKVDLTGTVNANITPGEFCDFAISAYFEYNTPTRYVQLDFSSYHSKSTYLSKSTPPIYDLQQVNISETNETTDGIKGAYFPKTYTKLLLQKTGTDNTLTSTGSISASNLALTRTDLGKFEINTAVGTNKYKLFNPVTSSEYVNEGDQIENVYLVDLDNGEYYHHAASIWTTLNKISIKDYSPMTVQSAKITRLNLAYVVNHKVYMQSNFTEDGEYIQIQISEIWKTSNGGITWTKSPIVIPDYSWMDP